MVSRKKVIDAVSKTIAELTSQQDGVIRQREALTTFGFPGPFDPTPMLDRPGGHSAARKRLHENMGFPKIGA